MMSASGKKGHLWEARGRERDRNGAFVKNMHNSFDLIPESEKSRVDALIRKGKERKIIQWTVKMPLGKGARWVFIHSLSLSIPPE